MSLNIEKICSWADTGKTRRNFKEGQRILEAGHILSCGKKINPQDESVILVTSFCLSTSQLKRFRPHTIQGKILRDGTIISMSCTCKAGLGEKCKHVMGTLLWIDRYFVNSHWLIYSFSQFFSEISCGQLQTWAPEFAWTVPNRLEMYLEIRLQRGCRPIFSSTLDMSKECGHQKKNLSSDARNVGWIQAICYTKKTKLWVYKISFWPS